MKDSVLAGTGNSRYLKSSVSNDTTWQQALALLRGGTFPIDLNGINNDGFSQLGTPLNKSTILPDALAARLNLGTNATLADFLGALLDKVSSTGWIDLGSSCSLPSGSAATMGYDADGYVCSYRVEHGNHVFVHVHAAFNFSGAFKVNTNSIPTPYCPGKNQTGAGRKVGYGAFMGSYGLARAYVSPGGDVYVESLYDQNGAHATLNNVTWCDITIDYFVD